MREAVSQDEILRDFDRLIEEKRLFGAARDPAIVDPGELVPTLVKKRGKGTRFLIRRVPFRRTLLRRWRAVFGTTISPWALFEALAAKTHEFEHHRNLLLFSRNRIIYDTQIHRGEENIGELTLSFAAIRDPAAGVVEFLKGRRRKVVYIEHLRVSVQRAGYASTLFRFYEGLFRNLGFQEFQLNATLSIGKYYWAVEGFDFADPSEIGKRRAELRTFIKERNLAVDEAGIDQLDHAFDFARFRREMKIPVYRDAEGFHAPTRDDRFREEVSLPLGKAFLLCSKPWEGRKAIKC